MIDPRFFVLHGPIAAADLAGAFVARGDGARKVSGLAPLETAGPDDLAYHEGKSAPPATRAGVLVIDPRKAPADITDHCTVIESATPRATYARLATLLASERGFAAGAPFVDETARIEEGARIGPGAVIGADAEIGRGAVIGPNAVIGPGVAIGRESHVGASCSVFCAYVGDGVRISPGTRIGQPGFGVAFDAGGPVDVPHFGRVLIQDGASIGANVTIDRGMFGDTTVGELVKMDNLCHIAHNVTLERAVIMAGCAGISGSTVIGSGVFIGGSVGIADHVKIGRGAMLAAGAGVMHDVPAGETWGGYPARPIRSWLREIAWLKKNIGSKNADKG